MIPRTARGPGPVRALTAAALVALLGLTALPASAATTSAGEASPTPTPAAAASPTEAAPPGPPKVTGWSTRDRGGRTGGTVRDTVTVSGDPDAAWVVHVQARKAGTTTWRTYRSLRLSLGQDSSARLTVSLPIRRGTWAWRLSVTAPGLASPVRTASRLLVGSTAACVWGTTDLGRPPAASGSGKRIVWRKSTNQVWLVDGDGAVRCSYPVTDLDWKTPRGTYRVRSESRVARSGRWYLDHMVRFHRRPGHTAWIGFHAVPRDSAGRLIMPIAKLGKPGYSSAGCVRQHPTNARTLYGFASVGTKVVVV